MATDPTILRRLQSQLISVLTAHIEPLFKPGTKLSIIARTPGNDEADVFITDDQAQAVVDLICRRFPELNFEKTVRLKVVKELRSSAFLHTDVNKEHVLLSIEHGGTEWHKYIGDNKNG